MALGRGGACSHQQGFPLSGPVVSSFRALSGRLKLKVGRRRFSKDFLLCTLWKREFVATHALISVSLNLGPSMEKFTANHSFC